MPSVPSVSVVIPCRNAADTLTAQLDALLRQTYRGRWEVLISDNGSTDQTRQLAERYAHRLPGLRVIDCRDRPGAGYARNVAAAASTADRLVFCDADDEVAPDWLEQMMLALDRDRFVAGRLDAAKLNSAAVVRSRTLPQSTGLQESPFGPGLPHASAENMGIHHKIFAAIGGFDADVRILEDTDLCWRVQLAGTPLAFAERAVVHVRLRSTFSGMWKQGWGYGHADALLEERYGPGASDPAAVNSRPAGRLSRLRRLATQYRSPEALVWTLGWHVGHRAFARKRRLAGRVSQTRRS
jgi:glycosyltransferase involved in cell wall biosynthesis